jgi:hypothetical protein
MTEATGGENQGARSAPILIDLVDEEARASPVDEDPRAFRREEYFTTILKFAPKLVSDFAISPQNVRATVEIAIRASEEGFREFLDQLAGTN